MGNMVDFTQLWAEDDDQFPGEITRVHGVFTKNGDTMACSVAHQRATNQVMRGKTTLRRTAGTNSKAADPQALARAIVYLWDGDKDGSLVLDEMRDLWQMVESSPFFDANMELKESEKFFGEFQKMRRAPGATLRGSIVSDFLSNFPRNVLGDILQRTLQRNTRETLTT